MKTKYIFYFLLILTASSCRKYLDVKPDKALNTAINVQGLQGFLDNYSTMNYASIQAGEIAADNYYHPDALYSTLRSDPEKDAYLWKNGVFKIDAIDWSAEYNIVYFSNIVLEGLEGIERTASNSSDWDNCKGSALVFRAKSFFEIAQVWSQAYDSMSAKTDLGIPLRLSSDFNVASTRASNDESYQRIIADLKAAVPLLPNISSHVYRPSKAAAYGLLARTYLAMRKYPQARLYADSCLGLNNKLIDYNTLPVTGGAPFGGVLFTNPEDIFNTRTNRSKLNLIFLYGRVDSSLYRSYDANDLRKSAFFTANADGTASFKAEYENANITYNGVATDEIYLTRAECLARLGDVADAIKDLNAVLLNRWKTGTFVSINTNDPATALATILTERRKELFFRMLRFTDIKRLNKEGANIIVKRVIQGQTYILQPNESRYALPIPDPVLRMSTLQQNPGW